MPVGLVPWIAIPATHLGETTMSLHEITNGRDPNRKSNDARRGDADGTGRSGRDGESGAGGHRSPSNGGPNGETSGRAPADSDTGEQVSALAVEGRESEGRESEGPDTEEVSVAVALAETVVSAYSSVADRSISEPDRAVIGMQSQMGRPSAERPSSRFCGAASDLVRLRSSSGDRNADSGGHDPACAQASGYLASRR